MGGAQPTFADVTIYFWYLIFITLDVCVINFYDLSAWDGCWSSVSIWRFIYRFLDVCPFDSTTVAVSGKVGPVNRLTTPVGWLLSFQLTVLSRSAIAVLSNFFVSSLCIFDFWWSFCLCGVFVIRLRQISSLFSCFHFSGVLMPSHAGTTESLIIDELEKFPKYAPGRVGGTGRKKWNWNCENKSSLFLVE